MPYDVENAFIQDPEGFIQDNVISPNFSLMDPSGTYGVKLVPADVNTYGVTKRGKHKAKRDTLNRYLARKDDNSPLRMYLLHHSLNKAHGLALGVGNAVPRFMITATMNSCTFGYNQTSDQTPAYVSHHNAQADGNDATFMESQNINWHHDVQPPQGSDYSFSHRTDYMKYIGKDKGANYQATLLGIRDGHIWHFFYQVLKGHDRKHKNMSLKGVKEIGVG